MSYRKTVLFQELEEPVHPAFSMKRVLWINLVLRAINRFHERANFIEKPRCT
jgi:hypothetical protein